MKQYILIGKIFINTYESMWNLLPQSAFFGSMLFFINKYLFNDWDYAIWLAILVGMDTFLGFGKNLIRGTLSLDKMNKFAIKLICYLSVLVMIHVLMNFTVKGSKQVVFDWLSTVAYTVFLTREALSIILHIDDLRPGFLPPFLYKFLDKYNEKIEEQFTDKNKE